MVANQQTDGHLTDEDRALIREEEQFLERVQSAIRRAELGTADQTRMRQVHGRMVELRDEAARAAESDLPSLLEALHTHQALASRPTATELPDERSPYFAHMRLRENGRARDVLLGHRTFIDAKARITVIDWRHAPLSRIFYTYKEGEEYEEVLPGRVANGVMEMRRVITVQDGKLVRISTPDRTYRRNGGPEWIADAPQQAPQLQGGEGTATRGYTALGTGQGGRPAPEVSALLDEQQFNILNADDAAPMMILGGAGCGKTTVALHRMSALNYRNPERYKPERMLVVVPEEGLVRLSKKLLAGLHLSRVPVSTFDDWVARQARMLIRGLSRRRYDLTPPRVSRFKRHPAMLDVLPEFVAARHEQIANRLRRTLSEAKAQVDTFAADSEGPLVERLRRLERSVMEHYDALGPEGISPKDRQEAEQALAKEKDRLFDLARDRRDLFADKHFLERAVAVSGGELTPGMVNDVYNHSIAQFDESDSTRYAGIDQDKLRTVDNRLLTDETPDEIAGSIDAEDFAILLYLLYLKTGRFITKQGRMHRYMHMVIDEAQDLAPIELKILGHALRHDGAVTIAGDSAQQIDPSTSFENWDKVLELLDVPGVEAEHLKTTYRSPAPIAEFAHAILGPIAPAQKPRTVKDGVPVERSFFPNEGIEAVFLTEALAELTEREPGASVAIICRSASTAKRLFDGLDRLPGARLVLHGEFEFTPGIDVTDVSQVKGLEFDYVVIPDADANAYPDTPEARRMMHVAATRAIHQLWVVALGKPSPVLPPE